MLQAFIVLPVARKPGYKFSRADINIVFFRNIKIVNKIREFSWSLTSNADCPQIFPVRVKNLNSEVSRIQSIYIVLAIKLDVLRLIKKIIFIGLIPARG